MTEFETQLARIASLTENNFHSGAYMLGCDVLKHPRLKAKFELISKLCEIEGYVPHELSKYRYSVYQEMMQYADDNLTTEEYALFYNCF